MKLISGLSALSFAISLSVNAANTEFGSRSEAMESLHFADNVVYVNSQYITDEDIEVIRVKLNAGDVIVIDNTEAPTADDAKEVTSQLAGMGMSSPVVIVRSVNGTLEFDTFNFIGDNDASYSDFYFSDESKQALSNIIGTVQQELSSNQRIAETQAIMGMARTANDDSAEEEEKARNEETIYVNARKYGIKCEMPNIGAFLFASGFWDEENKMDPCDGKSNANFRYTIDLIRSEKVNHVQDNNYVRVSISPEKGGTGIFLTKELVDERMGWINFLGPFADTYGFEVYSSDPDVLLAGHIPKQANPEQQVSETTGVEVGVTVSAGASGESSGGGSGNVGVSYSYTYRNSTTISFITNEYTVENLSGVRPETAAWEWDRHFEENVCGKLFLGGGCSKWTHSFDPFAYDLTNFSAISHNNFVPGFAATFETDPNKKGSSDFHIDANIGVMGVISELMPWLILAGEITLRDTHISNVPVNTEFTINWDQVAALANQGEKEEE